MGVNRNDPCPCGSGKKYKHCHMRSDQAQAKSGKATRDVRRVITPRTIPYFYWKRWNTARSRGEYGLLYDMTHEEGAYRGQFESRVEFFAHAQSHPLPSGPGWRLEKIKVDETQAWVLSERGASDPGSSFIELELMHLKKTALGWRLFDVKQERVEKAEEGDTFLAFDVFGVESADFAHHKRVLDGFERPDLSDRENNEPGWAEPGSDDPEEDAEAGESDDDASAEADAEGGDDTSEVAPASE